MEKLIKADKGYEVLDRLFSRIQSNDYVATQNMFDKAWKEWCALAPVNIEKESSGTISAPQTSVIATNEDATDKKKFYAITTSMTFEKTVLVPADCVDDIDDAMDLVNYAVEACDINLLDREALYCTMPVTSANKSGIRSMTETESSGYQILDPKKYE